MNMKNLFLTKELHIQAFYRDTGRLDLVQKSTRQEDIQWTAVHEGQGLGKEASHYEQVMDLKNKVAVITGGTSGIGAAVARDLAPAGVRLVLSGRRVEKLEQLAAELNAAAGADDRALVLAGEITDPEMPGRLLERAREAHGRCDIVFNNAGINVAGPIETIDALLSCTLIDDNTQLWRRWLKGRGCHDERAGQARPFSDLGPAVTSATLGEGVVLAPKALVDHHLRLGALVAMDWFGASEVTRHYYLYWKSTNPRQNVEIVRDWLCQTAAQLPHDAIDDSSKQRRHPTTPGAA